MAQTGKMLIASRVGDGRAVFRAPDGTWVESIAAGALADAADAADLLAAAQADEHASRVIEPYVIDVAEPGDATTRIPTVGREAIRALGPTVHADGT